MEIVHLRAVLLAAFTSGILADVPSRSKTTDKDSLLWEKQYITTASGAAGFRTELGTGIWLTIEHTPQKGDAMLVQRVQYDPVKNMVLLKGELLREVSEGKISKKIRLGKLPSNFNAFKRLSMRASFHHAMGKKMRKTQEPLCAHLKAESCPLKAGQQELRFAFEQLPKVTMVGQYVLEANVSDTLGQPVTSIQAYLDVPPRTSTELKRALWETSGRRLCTGTLDESGNCDPCSAFGVKDDAFVYMNGEKKSCTEAANIIRDSVENEEMEVCARDQTQMAENGCCNQDCTNTANQGGCTDKMGNHWGAGYYDEHGNCVGGGMAGCDDEMGNHLGDGYYDEHGKCVGGGMASMGAGISAVMTLMGSLMLSMVAIV